MTPPPWYPSRPSLVVGAAPNRNATYLDDIARVSNAVRDEHWMRVILDAVARGERVFVVGGGSHAIVQEPVLRAEL